MCHLPYHHAFSPHNPWTGSPCHWCGAWWSSVINFGMANDALFIKIIQVLACSYVCQHPSLSCHTQWTHTWDHEFSKQIIERFGYGDGKRQQSEFQPRQVKIQPFATSMDEIMDWAFQLRIFRLKLRQMHPQGALLILAAKKLWREALSNGQHQTLQWAAQAWQICRMKACFLCTTWWWRRRLRCFLAEQSKEIAMVDHSRIRTRKTQGKLQKTQKKANEPRCIVPQSNLKEGKQVQTAQARRL